MTVFDANIKGYAKFLIGFLAIVVAFQGGRYMGRMEGLKSQFCKKGLK